MNIDLSTSFGDPSRRNAEEFLALIHQQKQGKLKIYLGACPGVGKTYQMLVEGNRLKKRGLDVVIGYVEPHARPETTAQIGELEIIPPIVTQYKGVELREMDTTAVIARAPTVTLVDELAHTNAPGGKTKKRCEDVEDLLAAGINIISTLNIQHLESLYNVVGGATGVRVKERIPDEFLTRADQIVNIDLPAEDLIERLEAGKIYPQERVAQSRSNYFTPQNLTRLRELALSESANFLDRRQRAEEHDAEEHRPGGVGQVAVALSSGGPDPGPSCAKPHAWPRSSTLRGTPCTCARLAKHRRSSRPSCSVPSQTRWRPPSGWAAWSSCSNARM